MDGGAFAADGGAGRCGGEEVGFTFDGGGVGAGREILNGGQGAECVGKGHGCAAVENGGDGAEIVADQEVGDDFFGSGLQDLDPE